MKVLHLISGGDTGGAKTHVLSLVKELDKHVDAKIICFIEEEFYNEGKKIGLDIDVIKQKKRYDLHVLKRLKQIIEKEDYDIVHSHGARANFICMLLKFIVKKPFVTTIHSDYKLDFKDSVYKKFVYTTLNKISLKCFDYYITISNNFKRMLIDRGFKSGKIFTAYNGISFEEKVNIISKEEFLGRYNIDYNNKTIVGILGRLDAVKNHEVFIKAAKKVLENNKEVLFIIGGSGGEEDRLKNLVKEYNLENNIKFLGFVTEPNSFINAIDINVLTSISESFPYVILEGARLKKTIITTRVGGLEDLVEDDFNGYLFNVGDYERLSIYLDTLIKDKEKTVNMGNNLYETVKSKFSLENMGNDHYEIYKKIKGN